MAAPAKANKDNRKDTKWIKESNKVKQPETPKFGVMKDVRVKLKNEAKEEK